MQLRAGGMLYPAGFVSQKGFRIHEDCSPRDSTAFEDAS